MATILRYISLRLYGWLLFTARRYAQVRSLLSPGVSQSVRLSVCPSRWWIVSRRLKILSNFFCGPVAPSFEFFDPRAYTQFQGEPLQQGHKIQGVGNYCNFQLKSPIYLGNGTR